MPSLAAPRLLSWIKDGRGGRDDTWAFALQAYLGA